VILENVGDARAKARAGDLLFGNIDTFLVWNLTGGARSGVHVTDVTNASRTQLMNLKTLDWDTELLEALTFPRTMLPEVRSSSEVYEGSAVARSLCGANRGGTRDQQAALVGASVFPAGRSEEHLRDGLFFG